MTNQPQTTRATMPEKNAVEVISSLAQSANRIANAITAPVCGSDATGAHVESLTEAVMGMTDALCQIAGAIQDLAEAVRDR